MAEDKRTRAVGINHVALEVGNVEEALDFYGKLFDLELRGRSAGMAFVDFGDQFLALSEGRRGPRDEHRHFGLVVDDREGLRRSLEVLGVEILPGRGLEFRDPWGNRVQIVTYSEIQFTKAPHVLRGMGLSDLHKSPEAVRQLTEKGMAPRD
jgi:predicted enzyme related to lactoylglutathione lyase